MGSDASPGAGLSAEDAKLVTLARGARGRIGAQQGAALRDETGRTYAAADVRLDSLALSALDLAVANAVSSGSRGVEAAVVVGATAQDPPDFAVLRDLGGPEVPVHLVGPDGTVLATVLSGV